MGINQVYNQQSNLQISRTQLKIDGKNNTATLFNETIKYSSKKDFLDISAQTKILNEANNRKIDYSALEQKIGIDSSKWGVEAVSDNIFKFVTLIYENYKLNHEGEDDQTILDNFYEMARSSVQSGYDEALKILGSIDSNTKQLIEGTLERTFEKIDNWYENGGTVKPKQEINSETTSETAKSENISQIISEMMEESNRIKNEVVKMLEQQGIYLNEKSTHKPSINIEG